MKMRTRLLPSLILFAIFLASCAPAAATETAAPPVPPPTATLPPPAPTQPPSDVTEASAETVPPTPFPIATSRGPDLHATDPTTVNLASGQLQFVEFFRFT